MNKKQEYYQKNKQKILEKAKLKYREKHPEVKRTKLTEEEKQDYNKKYYNKYKEKYKKLAIENYNKNRDRVLEYKKQYREINKDSINDNLILWRKNNPDKVKQYNEKIRKDRGYCRYYEISKEKRRKQARPLWIDKDELLNSYRNCPDDKQVDHIIPLINKNVCGLDVPWNLQYLSQKENNFKRNSFDFTYDNEKWRKRFNKKS